MLGGLMGLFLEPWGRPYWLLSLPGRAADQWRTVTRGSEWDDKRQGA